MQSRTTVSVRRCARLVLRAAYRVLRAIEGPHGSDPWAVAELPFGLWRVRAAVARALERFEELE